MSWRDDRFQFYFQWFIGGANVYQLNDAKTFSTAKKSKHMQLKNVAHNFRYTHPKKT